MNNNFTNQNPFKGHYPDLLKNYSDMVNQPTPTDSLADSFNKQAEGMSSTGAMNQAAKGVLGSIGASFKGTADAERQEKLSPYLEMAGQITAKAAELEAQNQQEEARKNNGTNLVRSQMSLITTLGNSTAKGAVPEATGQARALGDAFQKAFGIDLGEFDSYDLNTRRIFYRNEDGTVTGYNIADELREYAQSAFGEQAPYIMQKFDPYYKDVYENTEQMKQLALEKERADIANKQASANLHNTQADAAKYGMGAPKVNEYEEKYNIQAALKNQDEIYKNVMPKLEKQEKTFDMYSRLEAAIDKASVLRGGSSSATVLRFFAKELGMDDNIAEAKMTSLQLESTLKEMLGAQFGQQEGDRILGKMVGPDKNYAAAKKQIQQERQQLAKDIVKNKIRVDTFAKEKHANLEHPELYQNLDNQIADYLSKKGGTSNDQNSQASSSKDKWFE